MERIDVLIPSRGRIAKLSQLLTTIPGQAWGVKIYPHILVDGDIETYEYFRNRNLIVNYFEGHSGSVALRNSEAEICEDVILWAVDDMEFKPGAIESATRAMMDRFPDGDGVVGFVQEGQKSFHPTGVGMMGQKFLQRYPGKHPFFPEYFLFACQEIHWLCTRIKESTGKETFYQEPRAVVLHEHPCEHPEKMDQTHYDGRIRKVSDVNLRKARATAGLVWGWR